MKNRSLTLLAMMALSLALAGTGALILTDAGQILGVSKSLVIGYFRVHVVVMAAAVLSMVAALVLNRRWERIRRRWMVMFTIVVVGCLIATKFATPYILFPSQQYSTEYRPAAGLDGYLEPDDVVYVVEHNGVVRAYPQKLIWQAHIFGGQFGEDEVVFTYCVLTNLPVPYVNDLAGEPMDLRVLAQTNNNLLMWDTNSGEIIQQITSTCDLSKRRLEPLPLVEMSWKAYRELCPGGSVAWVEFASLLERTLDTLMPLEAAHGGDDWMFPTVDVSDDRLHSKQKIIGVADGDEAVAYTRDHLAKAGIVNLSIGERRLVLAHLPEHDIVVAFDRRKDGVDLEVTEVDFHGNTPDHGRLARAFVFNGPMWAVWRHYYPETALHR